MKWFFIICFPLMVFCEQKTALIFGVTGQDGCYLAKFLLKKGYDVHGVRRRASTPNTYRIASIMGDNPNFFLHYGDLTDGCSILQIIKDTKPDEIYNLAAQSDVKISFSMPEYTSEVDGLGTLKILEAIRLLNMEKKVRYYQASTSELYGLVQEIPQKETTPFYPRSPYGCAKLFAYWITINYRESYGMYACNGILFNHESPYRGENFVTRKITKAASLIKTGQLDTLYLGNLNAKRDWGYTEDYIEAMWLMLQQDIPRDFVIATGKTHSVREFVEMSFKEMGITIIWKGEGVDEIGINKKTKQVVVKIDPKFYRPCEVELLIGDPSLAKEHLNWEPKTTFKELVHIMVQADYNRALKSNWEKQLFR